MQSEQTASKDWKITWQGVIATLLMVALCLTPFFAVAAIGFNGAGIGVAFFLIISFWFPAYKVIRLSSKSKELPVITGGPSFSTNWKRPQG